MWCGFDDSSNRGFRGGTPGCSHPIDEVIEGDTATFGVYRLYPQARYNVLSDIRTVAGRVQAHATIDDLKRIIAPDLMAAVSSVDERLPRRDAPATVKITTGRAAPARAAVAAVSAAAALNVLNRLNVAEAGESLRWLVTTAKDRGLSVSATNIVWGTDTTPILTATQLIALGPVLRPSDQLRYRIGIDLPKRPTSDVRRTDLLVQRLPTMLWPEWSLRMDIPGSHQRTLRQALPLSLLLIGSRLNLNEAATMIDSPMGGHAASRILQILEKHNQWDGIRLALIRMADYLAAHQVPIDYRRRRQLDYSTLLPDKVWARICRDTGTPGVRLIRARIARCFLFERLSGQSANKWSMFPVSSEFRFQVADFPRHLTAELNGALNDHAQEFLAERGISNEPTVWQPPAAVLDGLDLPRGNPDEVKMDDLHRAVTLDGMMLGTAARCLNTSLDVVRYLLETNPASTPVSSTTVPGNWAYVIAKAALPRARLFELYERQQMSLRDIAESVGVSRQVIGRLAIDYDVALRGTGRRVRTIIDREWLHDQYVNQRRTLPDLAKEAGMSTANMALWAKTHEIPLRARGTYSHRSVLRAAELAANGPELLRPALAGVGGRERLERFVAASSFRTIAVAAENLGIRQVTLVTQINRVERELGMKLLTRAVRGRPMRVTDDGSRVVAAVRSYRDRGWQ